MSQRPKTYRQAFFESRRFDSDKWEHYFEIYDHLLGHLYGADINFVEIGVQNGGSLEVAKSLFGSGSKIIGVDIDPRCKELKAAGLAADIIIGSQVDPLVLRELLILAPQIDCLIDDGSHIQSHMINTFITLFPHIKEDGIYIIEDTHTNYSPEHQDSFFGIGLYDYFKGLSERLNIDFIDPDRRKVRFKTPREVRPFSPVPDGFLHQIFSIQFFDSVIAVRKRTKLEPLRVRRSQS